MKISITILLAIAVSVAFSQNERKLLKKAFKKKSDVQLRQFFQHWNEEIQPISEAEWTKLNTIQKETYNAFTAFYQPDSIELLGGSEMGKDIYAEAKFLIIQDFIEIYTTEKVYYSEDEKEDYVANFIKMNVEPDSIRQLMLERDEDGKLSKEVLELFPSDDMLPLDIDADVVDSIVNFRPAIISEKKQPLYLTPKYRDILNKFLGKKFSPLGKGGIMKAAGSKGKSAKRKQFLEKYIKIWPGHWGGYWHLHSYPMATSITFDKNMEFAKLDFRMVYEGGEAILKKENGNWVIVTAKRTWIE